MENKNHDIFVQLIEMFGEKLKPEVIEDICTKHNWQLEYCIEDLIKYVEDLHQTTDIKDTSKEEEVLLQNLGAIPKNNKTNNLYDSNSFIPINSTKIDFSNILRNNIQDFKFSASTSSSSSSSSSNQQISKIQRKREAVESSEVLHIIENIKLGNKIMILMRGAPGSGKTYLARYIIQNTIGNDFRNHIFSSDDYFYNVHDEYVYKKEKIPEAHEFNQKRVRKKAAQGWSPIIVDNTNIKIWEMFPYVHIAVQYGYIIYILEPDTDWCHSAGKLSLKNKHGVPKDKIEIMLKNFEPITVDELIKINNLSYNVQLPQLRHYPPLDKFLLNKTENDDSQKQDHDLRPSVAEPKENLTFTNFEFKFDPRETYKLENDEVKISEIPNLSNNFEFKNDEKNCTQQKEFDYIENIEKLHNFNDLKQNSDDLKSEQKSTFTNFEFKFDVNEKDKVLYSQQNIDETKNDVNDIWTDYDDVTQKTNTAENSKNLISNIIAQNAPKPARNTCRTRAQNTTKIDSFEDEIVEINLPGMKDSDWKSYEEESNEFWNMNQNTNLTGKKEELDVISTNVPKPKRNSKDKYTTNICSLLKNDSDNSICKKPNNEMDDNKLERHRLDCENESKSFLMLRQIYKDRDLVSLWDLFEKCNGDVNWTIDILLKDSSCCLNQEELSENDAKIEDYFKCNCKNIDNQEQSQQYQQQQNKENSSSPEKIPRYKIGKKEKLNFLSPEMLEAKRAIEKQIVLSKDCYSQNIQKLLNFRHGIEFPSIEQNNSMEAIPSTSKQQQQQQDKILNEDNNEDEENFFDNECDDMIEINLGENLIKQLESTFNTESNINYSLSDFKTNVFMPKNLAKQLYALWMESLYNQMEEQKQNAIKEDEEFARFLQNPKLMCQTILDKKNDFKDIMDMDLAWTLYKLENKNRKNSKPTDLATHLTRMKLYELFPNIDKDTLLEILIAHDNKFSDTVEILKDSLKGNIDEDIQLKRIDLLKQAKDESDKNIADSENQCNKRSTEIRSTEIKLGNEEAKKIALKDFEESRNLAVHHSQLKGECYRKAKEAIQKGNHAIAVYYSQIANLHKSKIEKYNHKAASCIMEIQSLNQNNPDLIDLHYLHVLEAIECLDVFIDKQITKLKNLCRSYKFVFIITGRGLHSTGGVSAIKNKVKTRLRERNLTWSEANPGLLKVKIYAASRYSRSV